MPTFRRTADEERVRHQTVLDQAFGDEPGPPAYAGAEDLEDRIGQRWGLYDDGELLSACLLYDLEATLADGTAPVGGVGGFATPPEHRSAGHGTTLQRAFLEEFRDRGYPYAILWPMSIPYYRHHGWGLAHLQTAYEFTPAAIEGLAEPTAGAISQVGPEAAERLAAVYDVFRDRYQLALDRTPAWWRERVLADAWAYTWTPADADEPAGYVIGTLPGGPGEMTLTIDELVALDERARRALLAFVHDFHPQVNEIRWECPAETRLVHDATDPKAVTATVEPGAMGRIVDVPRAIERLPADRNPPAPVTITVADARLEWNDGTITVEASPDGPSVSDGATEAAAGDAIQIDIGVLSRLYVGATDVDTLRERETFAGTETDWAALAALFPSRSVYLPDFF